MRRPKLIGCAGISPSRESLRICFREQWRNSAAMAASTKCSCAANVLWTETGAIGSKHHTALGPWRFYLQPSAGC